MYPKIPPIEIFCAGTSLMAEKLCAEIVAAYNNEGGAFKRKEDMHKMAEANKAFAHFRF